MELEDARGRLIRQIQTDLADLPVLFPAVGEGDGDEVPFPVPDETEVADAAGFVEFLRRGAEVDVPFRVRGKPLCGTGQLQRVGFSGGDRFPRVIQPGRLARDRETQNAVSPREFRPVGPAPPVQGQDRIGGEQARSAQQGGQKRPFHGAHLVFPTA